MRTWRLLINKARIFLLFSFCVTHAQQHDHSFLHRFLPGFSLRQSLTDLSFSYQINNTLSYLYDDPNLISESFPMMVDMEMHAFDIHYKLTKYLTISSGFSKSTTGVSDNFIKAYHDVLNIKGKEFTYFGMNKNLFFLNHDEIYHSLYLRPISISVINTVESFSYAFTFSHQIQDLAFAPSNMFSTQILWNESQFQFLGNIDLIFGYQQFYKNIQSSYQISYMIYEDKFDVRYYFTSPIFKRDGIHFSKKKLQFTTMGYNYLFRPHTLLGLGFYFNFGKTNIHLELLEDYINLFGKDITNFFLTHTNAPDFAIRMTLRF